MFSFRSPSEENIWIICKASCMTRHIAFNTKFKNNTKFKKNNAKLRNNTRLGKNVLGRKK